MRTYAIFTTKELAELAQDKILRERKSVKKLPAICSRWDNPVQKTIGRWYITLPTADYDIKLGELSREDLAERPVPTAEFRMSKLALRRFLREAELEPLLDEMLASSPTAQADWKDAQDLRTDDPLVVEFKNSALKLDGVTEEIINGAFQAAKIEDY